MDTGKHHMSAARLAPHWLKYPRLAQHNAEPADRVRLGLTFGADYAFMGSKETEKGMQPTFVMYDDDQMAFWALGVTKKEVNGPVVGYVVDVLDQ